MSRLAVLTFIGMLGICLAASAAAERKATNLAARRALDRVLPELKFNNVSLDDAIDFLRDASAANIHVNWRALEQINITPDMIVNLQLRGVSLRKAMSLLLSEAGGVDQLTFYIDDGVIEITTRQIADNIHYTKVYPVEDLLMGIPNFEPPSFNFQSGSDGNSGGGGLGGGGQAGKENSTTKTERADALVQLIRDTIQPEIWRENGGTASIRYFKGHLIITAPRTVHESIGGPLER